MIHIASKLAGICVGWKVPVYLTARAPHVGTSHRELQHPVASLFFDIWNATSLASRPDSQFPPLMLSDGSDRLQRWRQKTYRTT